MDKTEKCFGIIAFRCENDQVQVLILKHVKGKYWAFPKGHSESGEDPHVTAQRELFEETDLRVHSFLPFEYPQEDYVFQRDGSTIHKYITYYPALVEGEVSLKEPHEVSEALWLQPQEALKKITFENTKDLFQNFIAKYPDLSNQIRSR